VKAKSMKTIFLVTLFLGNVVEALAAERYVNVNNPSPAAPYLTWATAATTIQAAIDAASDGDVITVTNGAYQTGGSQLFQGYGTNRVSISRALLVRSVNGPAVTVINGGGTMRCVALVSNAVLSGFSLTNGANGTAAGALGDPNAYPLRLSTVTNCILSDNVSPTSIGAAGNCTLNSCILTNNASSLSGGFGGGAASGCDLNHCLISGNRSELGGGVWGCTLNDCILTNNYASGYGGGARDSLLNNCTIANNVANTYGGGATDCTMTNCFLTGNTVTNKTGGGGGVCNLGESGSHILVNCGLVNNRALGINGQGGGIYAPSTIALYNCALTNNSACTGGGVSGQGNLYDCILVGNQATNGAGFGGGVAAANGNISLERCILLGNSAKYGGGVNSAWSTYNCILGNNSASIAGGGFWGGVQHSLDLITNNFAFNGAGFATTSDNDHTQIFNCRFSGNSATNQGGATYGLCDLYSCTVAGNSALEGGGVYGPTNIYDDLPLASTSIIYHNTAVTDPNFHNASLDSCCSTPIPYPSNNNITNDPAFVNMAAGNFRLSSNSPCINFVYNAFPPEAPNDVDLDGNPRVVGGGMDMGAYEFQTPASGISYFWLQQYGLPTDGSADHADPDGDHFDNFSEWAAHTSPLDATSLLKILQVVPNGDSATVTWQSVPGVSYYVERSTNLTAAPPFDFYTFVGGAGDTNVTSYVDTGVAGPGPVFYRIRVQ
jgi:hypothetical protein